MEKIRNYAMLAILIAGLLPYALPGAVTISPSVNEFDPGRIHTGQEPGQETVTRFPLRTSQDSCSAGSIAWSLLENGQKSDDQYVFVSLAPQQETHCLSLEDFSFTLPKGTHIDAFKILIEGHIVGEKKPKELTVGLYDELGNPVSMDYAGKVSKGKSWPQPNKEKAWKYGIQGEDWLTVLNSDWINTHRWSIKLQLKNDSNKPIEVRIDQILVEIIHTPLYTLCREDCGIVFVEPLGDGYRYHWDLPLGMKITSVPVEHHIVNFMMTDNSYGIREICIDITAPDGSSARLCRDILLQNCSPSSIGDLVWLDANANGIQDSLETGIPGILLHIKNTDGSVAGSMITDSLGLYAFTNLPPGDYYLSAVLPDPFIPTFFQVDSNSFLDSDFFPAGSECITQVFTLGYNQQTGDLDLGLIPKAAIGDFVWLDVDANGLQDPGETGLDGINVYLFNENGTLTDSRQSSIHPTDSTSGYFLFDGLYPGEYYLQIDLPGDSLQLTTTDAGADDLDSDFFQTDSLIRTPVFSLGVGEFRSKMDVGFILRTGSISGLTWIDIDENGLRDTMEPLLPDIKVILLDQTGLFLGEQFTGPDGTYLFQGLIAGQYYLLFEATDAYEFTIPYGPNPHTNSDVTGAYIPGSTDLIVVAVSQDVIHIDAGFRYNYARVGDFVWIDQNENGIQDPLEKGADGIPVELYNESHILIKTTVSGTNPTNGESGYYVFDSLVSGKYYLRFDPGQALFTQAFTGVDIVDSDVSGAFGYGTTELFALMPGVFEDRMDAGIIPENGDLSGFIWLDLNANGILEDNENGIDGILVNLIREDGSFYDATVSTEDVFTGRSGYYSFRNIPIGSYYLTVELPGNYVFSPAQAGSDDAIDSEFTESIEPGSSDLISIVHDQLIENYNAGAYIPSSIGDFVWLDVDGDGLQGVGEAGLGSIEIHLLKDGFIPVDTTYTDSLGFYRFTGLKQGVYAAQFMAPPEYGFTVRNIGPDDAIDSDVGSNGKSPLISLAHGAQFYDLDAGLIPLSNLVGNLVFYDLNRNDIREESEPAAAACALQLMDSDNRVVHTGHTQADGTWAFTDLPEGTYRIRAILDRTGMPLDLRNSGFRELEKQKSTGWFTVKAGTYIRDIRIGFKPKPDQSMSEVGGTALIYPNPFLDHIWLEWNAPLEERVDARLYNMGGQMVRAMEVPVGTSLNTMDLTALPPGQYLLRIATASGIMDQQWIIKTDR